MKKMTNEEIKSIIKDSLNKSIEITGYYLACYMKRHNLKWSQAPEEMDGWGVGNHILEAMCEYCAKKFGVSRLGYGDQKFLEKVLDNNHWGDAVIDAAKFAINAGIVPTLKNGEALKRPEPFDATIWSAIQW